MTSATLFLPALFLFIVIFAELLSSYVVLLYGKPSKMVKYMIYCHMRLFDKLRTVITTLRTTLILSRRFKKKK